MSCWKHTGDFAHLRAQAVEDRLRDALPEFDFKVLSLTPGRLRVRWTDPAGTRVVRDVNHPASLAGTWCAVVEAVVKRSVP